MREERASEEGECVCERERIKERIKERRRERPSEMRKLTDTAYACARIPVNIPTYPTQLGPSKTTLPPLSKE